MKKGQLTPEQCHERTNTAWATINAKKLAEQGVIEEPRTEEVNERSGDNSDQNLEQVALSTNEEKRVEIKTQLLTPISQLIGDYERQIIKIPKLQRKYVWSQSQVCSLFDSLYRNYPTGSILMWERNENEKAKEPNLSNLSNSLISQKLHLLDGQQRITSLTAVIEGKPIKLRKEGTNTEVEEKPIEIYFNLAHTTQEESSTDAEELYPEEDAIEKKKVERVFQIKNKKIENDKTWVPLTDIFKQKSSGQILHKLKIGPEDGRYRIFEERINKILKILDYQYPVTVLSANLDYDEATRIFIRVNSSGTRLSGSDLALALISSKWDESTDLFEEFIVKCEKEGYRIDAGFLIRCLISVTTGQCKFGVLNNLPIENLTKNWEKTKVGIEKTIHFLKYNALIESTHLQKGTKLLPSFYLLIPLSVYACENEIADTKEKENRFLEWFYTAAMWNRYGRGSSESILDEDLRIIMPDKKNIKDDPSRNLLAKIAQMTNNKERITIADIEKKQKNSSYFMMLHVLSRKNSAKDWGSGLALTTKIKIEVDHIFPKSLLEKNMFNLEKIKRQTLVNDIANLAFISKKSNGIKKAELPETYLPKLKEKRGKEALSSQSIPDSSDLWKLDRYEQFLGARRALLVQNINNLLESLKNSERKVK